MEIVIVLLLICVAALSVWIWMLKKEARRMAAHLRDTPERKLLLSLFDKDLSALASSVNAVVQRNQDSHLRIRRARQQWENELVNISHDLRTPLTSIIGYLKLLQNTPLTEVQAEHVSIVRNKAAMLNGLVQSFFDLAYYASAHYLPNLQPVPLADSVTKSLLGFVAEFEQKGTAPRVDAADESAIVIADAEMLARIWQNIISNALVHGEGAFAISITQNTVRFENELDSASPLDADRVFDRFYIADASRKAGSGVGLTIVRALTERMGGTASAERHGNRFVISVQLPSPAHPLYMKE